MKQFVIALLTTFPLLLTFAHAQSWRYTGSLRTERRMFTMDLLRDGRVLAVGGTDRNHVALRSCELFDPKTERWSDASPMGVARERHTATMLEDGRLAVIGGNTMNNRNNVVTASVEIYDPVTGLWSSGGRLRTARQNHTATLLNDGTILVTGGYNSGNYLGECEIYDPSTMSARDAAPLLVRRMDHQALLLESGEVMIAGGRIGGWNGTYLDDVEIYNPASRTWRMINPMLQPRITGFSLVRFSDGKVLAAGGRNAAESSAPHSEVLDPATMVWHDVEPMKVPCVWQAGVLMPFDLYLVTGGFYDAVWQTSNYVTATPTCEWFDKWHGRWYYAPKLNMQRAEHCAVYLQDCGNPFLPREVVLVAGGITGNDAITNTAEVLDITASARQNYMTSQEELSSSTPAVPAEEDRMSILNNAGAAPVVRFRVESVEQVRIDIVAADGRAIGTIAEGSYDAGTHRERIVMEGLPAGIYFVRLRAGAFTTAERVIVTR